MDPLDELRVRSLASVMSPDDEDIVLDIFEWYSEKYNTPLHTVQDLPLDDVLISYYRWVYKNMPPEELHNHAIWLLETPEERAQRVAADKASEDAFLRKAMEDNKKKKPSKAELAFKRMREKAAAAEGEATDRPELAKSLPNKPASEAKGAEVEPEPGEEVVIRYASAEEFEAELDVPLLPPKKKG